MPNLLAVIGHRDLRPCDLPTIQSALDGWWSRESGQWSDGTAVLLTSLAPGADQLVAWQLTRTDQTQRAYLRPVYPYEKNAYAAEVRRQEQVFYPAGCPWSLDTLAEGRRTPQVIQT